MRLTFAQRLALLVVLAPLACSGGTGGTSSGGDNGSSGGSGGATGAGTAGSSGGSSGAGSTGGVPTTCTIADAGKVAANTVDPGNPCQICDPSTSTALWSPAVVCFVCHSGGISGLCTAQGSCCTSHCDNSTSECQSTGADGGQLQHCATDSDCCGITAGCP